MAAGAPSPDIDPIAVGKGGEAIWKLLTIRMRPGEAAVNGEGWLAQPCEGAECGLIEHAYWQTGKILGNKPVLLAATGDTPAAQVLAFVRLVAKGGQDCRLLTASADGERLFALDLKPADSIARALATSHIADKRPDVIAAVRTLSSPVTQAPADGFVRVVRSGKLEVPAGCGTVATNSAIRDRLDGLRNCYRGAANRLPELSGELQLSFELDPLGRIMGTAVSGAGAEDVDFVSCVRGTMDGAKTPIHAKQQSECRCTFSVQLERKTAQTDTTASGPLLLQVGRSETLSLVDGFEGRPTSLQRSAPGALTQALSAYRREGRSAVIDATRDALVFDVATVASALSQAGFTSILIGASAQ